MALILYYVPFVFINDVLPRAYPVIAVFAYDYRSFLIKKIFFFLWPHVKADADFVLLPNNISILIIYRNEIAKGKLFCFTLEQTIISRLVKINLKNSRIVHVSWVEFIYFYLNRLVQDGAAYST